jgi:hypothetical protein
MPLARKSMLTLAAVLMTCIFAAPSFALTITGVDGESKNDPPPKQIELASMAAAPAASVCIYLVGTVICVAK